MSARRNSAAVVACQRRALPPPPEGEEADVGATTFHSSTCPPTIFTPFAARAGRETGSNSYRRPANQAGSGPDAPTLATTSATIETAGRAASVPGNPEVRCDSASSLDKSLCLQLGGPGSSSTVAGTRLCAPVPPP